jgi:uncharacterized protein YjiS (DUF1127 family)
MMSKAFQTELPRQSATRAILASAFARAGAALRRRSAPRPVHCLSELSDHHLRDLGLSGATKILLARGFPFPWTRRDHAEP